MAERDADELRAWGWDDTWSERLDALERDDVVAARVMRSARRSVELVGPVAPGTRARVPGRILREGPEQRPVVGDWLAVRERDGGWEVCAILPRRTLFRRRAAGRSANVQLIAANVDTVLLMMGLDADFNIRRIERYLTLASPSGASSVVVLNKTDLTDGLERQVAEVQAVTPGAPIVALSAKLGEGLEPLEAYLRPGATVALLGSSGVGKSTLVNRLLGHEQQPTAEVRERDGRGKHTTTARELIRLESGALLIDTPGMRELGLWTEDEDALDDAFEDVAGLAQSCRFRDCSHHNEPGCAVLAALEAGDLAESRLASYLKLRRELVDVAELARAKEARFKAISKQMKRRRKDER
jgi:ribosome biogenesis GTPase